jgi:hypothetical protein
MKRDRTKMAHNSHSLIREAVRAILREETVSVFRKGVESLYDVDFDDVKDEIVGGKKLDAADAYTDEVQDAMSIASKFTTVDKATLLNKITSYYVDEGMDLRQPVGTGREAVAILNRYWSDTINWPTKKGKGPGEVALHLAFDSDTGVSEPDFVSPDGSLRISLKYLGSDGQSTALSGTRSAELVSALDDLKSALRISSFPQSKWGEKQMYKALMAVPAEERSDVIDLVYSTMGRIKLACAQEHDANGVMLVTDSGFSYVNSQNAAQHLSLVYILDRGNRVEFGGSDRGNRTSIERGIRSAESETRWSQKRPERDDSRGKKSEAPPEDPSV